MSKSKLNTKPHNTSAGVINKRTYSYKPVTVDFKLPLIITTYLCIAHKIVFIITMAYHDSVSSTLNSSLRTPLAGINKVHTQFKLLE